jgi:predicted metal-binding membrane protein
MMFEQNLKRDRIVVFVSLGGIAALAWLSVWQIVGGMSTATGMMMTEPMAWSASDVAFAFVLWAVMMVAMMTPSVAPTIFLFARLGQERAEPLARTWIFLLGYLCVWFGFSALAALGQWILHDAGLDSARAFNLSLIGGIVLILAGIFQWTPLKQTCLAQCRSPQSFFLTEWRDGARGALTMGFKHGIFCLGCCWLLMALLFVLGAMNLWWMVALTLLILVEKISPAGIWVSRIAGVVFVALGVWTIFAT